MVSESAAPLALKLGRRTAWLRVVCGLRDIELSSREFKRCLDVIQFDFSFRKLRDSKPGSFNLRFSYSFQSNSEIVSGIGHCRVSRDLSFSTVQSLCSL
jgi:hypothetical protein